MERMTERARELRQRSTPAEAVLWEMLRGRRLEGQKFRRQWPLGGYILDFVCLEGKLIVEADGLHHLGQAEYDAVRDAFFEAQGFRVLRFQNNDILKRPGAVLEHIRAALTLAA